MKRSILMTFVIRAVVSWVIAGGTNIAASVALGAQRSAASGPPSQRQTRNSKETTDRHAGIAAGPDCNGNGIPDDVDIETCVGNPACDDCNINFVPDECDISAGTSTDGNANGVPDECVSFDDGGVDADWGTPENWDTDEVPNNLDLLGDESVTIGPFGVNLDLKVQVDTLRLRDGSTLNVTGLSDEDLEVKELGGIRVGSNAVMQSRLLLGDGRRISVLPGILEIGSGGILEVAQPPPHVTASSCQTLTTAQVPPLLEAGTIRVQSRCGEPIPGELVLSGTTVAQVYGNVVIDGSQDCVVCGMCSPSAIAGLGVVAGGETPPIIKVIDCAKLRIGGSLVLRGGSQLIHSSSAPIEISGDFINESICPQCFSVSGAILFTPPGFVSTAAVANPVQSIEVAGRDLGPTPIGFDTNFALGKLEVAPSTLVTFVDNFSNTNGAGTEALYVDTLIFRSGAIVTLSNCRVYYNNLTIDDGATIEFTGNGGLVPVGAQAAIPAISTWGLLMLAAGLGVAGTVIVARSGRTRPSHAS
jgi:hypothetical protein